MFLAVGWRHPGLWGQLTRVEGLLLEQMWNIERGILEEAHGREGPWRLLSLASRLCQGWNFTDQVVDVSLNVHKSVCIIVSFFFFFTHSNVRATLHHFDLMLKSFEKYSVFVHVAFRERDQLPESVLLLSRKSSLSESILWHGDF